MTPSLRHARLATLATLATLAAAGGTARADDAAAVTRSADRWTPSSVSVTAHLGLATPYGHFGGEVERSLAPWAAVAVGVGGAGAHAEKVMVAGAGRVRFVRGGHALGLSLGVGYGDSAEWKGPDVEHGSAFTSILNAVWLNGEAYYEYRFASHMMVRAYAGATRALRFDTCTSTDPDSECGPIFDGVAFPVAGLAVGGYF